MRSRISENSRGEIESIETAISRMEGRIIGAEVIVEDLKAFGTVYEHLTQEERYVLAHLLVKRTVYHEEPEADGEARKKAQ